jgi:hypothetical protein
MLTNCRLLLRGVRLPLNTAGSESAALPNRTGCDTELSTQAFQLEVLSKAPTTTTTTSLPTVAVRCLQVRAHRRITGSHFAEGLSGGVLKNCSALQLMAAGAHLSSGWSDRALGVQPQ